MKEQLFTIRKNGHSFSVMAKSGSDAIKKLHEQQPAHEVFKDSETCYTGFQIIGCD